MYPSHRMNFLRTTEAERGEREAREERQTSAKQRKSW